jgi:hypothetical protein
MRLEELSGGVAHQLVGVAALDQREALRGQLLDTVPIGLIVFPGSGITDNLADKARAMGVPLYDFRTCKPGAS